MILFYLIKESFLYAINSLVLNKLRTFLSLLGITIGIFAIISVFTVIDSLQDSIRKSIESLGDNVVYVQKWPWSMGGNYPWWKYLNRPSPKLQEVEDITRRSTRAKATAFMVFTSKTIQYYDTYLNNAQIVGTSHDYENIRTFEVEKGRYFSPFESANGSNRCIMGYQIASDLFESIDPIGKTVKLGGKKVVIIGVFKKEGDDLFGMSTDNQVIIPINYAKNLVNIRDERVGPMIMVKAKDKVNIDELIDELRGIMRSVRRLSPTEEDNFALNKMSIISEGFESLFRVMDIAGLIIGGFSILVGAFGIANIMFVSVKEQTQIIGIQKALGAKNYFIMLQFLYEAVILSLIGGILGLTLIFIMSLLISMSSSLTIGMSLWNISVGIIISVSVGVIAGLMPAYSASRLDPVVAMSTV